MPKFNLSEVFGKDRPVYYIKLVEEQGQEISFRIRRGK